MMREADKGKSKRWILWIGVLLMALAVGNALAAPGTRGSAKETARRGGNFDHLTTGFALSGAHARVTCETCHSRGVFKGTPTTCARCHTTGSQSATTAKPATHIPTNGACDQCHNTLFWKGARFDHTTVPPGGCMSCHNGAMAKGKPGGHVQTTASCDTCHSTRIWSPATFNHNSVAPGTCASCHNGSGATGKPGNHIITTASCDTCHGTRSWLPARFDHATVTPGTCASCHNGSTATGKPGNHIITTASCDSCHSTRAWVPASGVDHSTVQPGTCANCHNGSTATGKSGSHMVTSRSCDTCHSTTRWTPVSYSHTSPFYKAHSSSVSCRDCHQSSEVPWTFAQYKPDCAGCHQDDFKRDKHLKTEKPSKIYYEVGDLRDCTGSCHIYTDNTFTTIKDSKSGKHRPTSGDW